MKTGEPLESELDSLETFVIRSVHRASPAEGPDLDEALRGVHKRIANLPLTGLPAIRIPPVPIETLNEPLGLAASEVARKAAVGGLKKAAASGLPMRALVTAAQLKVAAITATVLATGLAVPLLMESSGQAPDASPAFFDVPSGEPPQTATPKREKSPRLQVPSLRSLDPSSRPSTHPLEPKNTSRGQPEASTLPPRHEGKNRAPSEHGSEREPHPQTTAPPTEAMRGDEVKAAPNQKSTTSEEAPGSNPRPRELTQELEQLQAAQRALRSGQPLQALDRVNQLDREVPGGALYPERQIIKVLALCALNRQTDARALATRLQESPSAAVYSARLRNTCVSGPSIVDQ